MNDPHHASLDSLALVFLWLLVSCHTNAGLSRNRRSSRTSEALLNQRHIDFLQRGQDQGYFKTGDSRERGIVLWSLMHGLANLVIDGQVAPENPMALGTSVAHFVRDALASKGVSA